MGKILMNDDAFSLDDSKRAALMAWMGGKLKSEAGMGIKIAKKFGGREVEFKTGYNGSFKLKNAGLGMGLTWAAGAGLGLASQGQLTLGFWGGLASIMIFSGVGPALEGSAGAWRSAREDGLGRASAFGRVCQRAARGMKANLLPNPWIVGAVATVPLAFVADKINDAVAARTPGGRLDDLSGRAAMGLARGAQWVVEGHDRFGDWVFEQEVEGARLEGAKHVGSDIYATFAKGWMTQRFFMAEVKADNNEEIAKMMDSQLSEAEKSIRSSYKAMIRVAPKDNKDMLKQIRMAEAARVDPWFKPGPGMPSTLDLAEAFAKWREAVEGRSEALDHKLSGWSTRVEAQVLRAVVGEAQEAVGAGVEAPRKRARL